MQIKLLGYQISLQIQRLPVQLTVEQELYQVHPLNWSEQACRFAIDTLEPLAKRYAEGRLDLTMMSIPRIKALRNFVAHYGWTTNTADQRYFGLKDAKDWVETRAHLFPK